MLLEARCQCPARGRRTRIAPVQLTGTAGWQAAELPELEHLKFTTLADLGSNRDHACALVELT
jgi:hypothetical protein